MDKVATKTAEREKQLIELIKQKDDQVKQAMTVKDDFKDRITAISEAI